jgi:amino acid transporter
MAPNVRRSIALAGFFAWVGLGADPLSSTMYGPEEAFRALGGHNHLALYLAAVTAVTVLVIAAGYIQVIALFPSGGGGYRVATKLIGPAAGLVSGAALVVDYVLTIAISIASGADALFSAFPVAMQEYKLVFETATIVLLIVLNLRGMKESILVLMPIFVTFVVTHVGLILYGILVHGGNLPGLFTSTVHETVNMAHGSGWFVVISMLLLAYSQGSGTYTGIEAVSNNVQSLAEPRVRTGKLTMVYLAVSLAFMAMGIVLLYLLWNVSAVEGKTLNAVVFGQVLDRLDGPGVGWGSVILPIVLLAETGLLFVAANTGFLGGPSVLAAMATDKWVPNYFASLSSRLVTKYGVLLMGSAATVILLATGGDVGVLVVLYSINVFITFSLSLLGMSVYWWKQRTHSKDWVGHFLLSALGLIVTFGILLVVVFEKFSAGGWFTLIITGCVVALCVAIKRHYLTVDDQMRRIDQDFAKVPVQESGGRRLRITDKSARTAVFLLTTRRGAGMHTILWVRRLFPGVFKNFVFVTVGEVDVASYGGQEALDKLRTEVHRALEYYQDYSTQNGFGSDVFEAYGTDKVAELVRLVDVIASQYPDSVFFASNLIFAERNWFARLLHNQTAWHLQRRLHLLGRQMVILPMKVETA